MTSRTPYHVLIERSANRRWHEVFLNDLERSVEHLGQRLSTHDPISIVYAQSFIKSDVLILDRPFCGLSLHNMLSNSWRLKNGEGCLLAL